MASAKQSVKRRLTLLVAVAGGAALLVSTVAFVATDVVEMRRSKVRQLTALAGVLASNSAAALSFDMPDAAAELLASMRERPTVEFACLFQPDGKIFAVYRRDAGSDFAPDRPEWEGHRFQPDGRLSIALPVREDGRKIGTIYVDASMDDVWSQVYRHVAIALGVMTVAFGVALVLASRLQRAISTPIIDLTATAERITAAGDYSIRVEPRSDDEIGTLYRQFNSMLQRIQTGEKGLRRLTAIIEGTGDFVGTIDSEGRTTYVNRAGRELVGFGQDEDLSGKRIADYHPAWALRIIQDVGIPDAIQNGIWEGETAVLGPDGEEIPVSQVIMAHGPGDGQFEFLSTIIRDISERRRATEEHETLIAMLEAQNAELERYAYTVSHDLKTPLITLKGFMGALLQDLAGGENEAVGHDVARMSQAADTMASLLDDLLELSRIGRVVNPPEDVSVTDAAREAMELSRGRIENANVRVVVADGLPAVSCDRPRLVEAMQNLIDNAVKYMGKQSDPVVEIGCRTDGDRIVCFVRDNGMGIDPKYHETVFGLFDQLDQDYEGSGVGLALVRRIVEIQGGRIWVESKGIGHGATFCFTLPAARRPTK